MMDALTVFWHGMLIGLIVAVPVGPVAFLVVRRTLKRGLFSGVGTGLGAATADGLFGVVAVSGAHFVLEVLRQHGRLIHGIGAVILLVLAWRIWPKASRAKEQESPTNDPAPQGSFGGSEAVGRDDGCEAEEQALLKRTQPAWLRTTHVFEENGGEFSASKTPLKRLARDGLTGFMLTLSNPATLFAMLAVVAAWGTFAKAFEGTPAMVGIFSGSLAWWCVLTGLTMLGRRHVRTPHLEVFNRITVVVIVGIALWAVWRTVG